MKLHDGREVSSDSLEWRDECLARHLLRIRPQAALDAWLEGFRKNNGEVAESELRARMAALKAVMQAAPKVTNRGTVSRGTSPIRPGKGSD